jgi:hypothetical protein
MVQREPVDYVREVCGEKCAFVAPHRVLADRPIVETAHSPHPRLELHADAPSVFRHHRVAFGWRAETPSPLSAT